MEQMIYIFNAAAVGLFGVFLSTSFCEICWTGKKRVIYGAGILAMALTQAAMYMVLGSNAIRLWYPLITHVPLFFLLWYLSGQSLWSMIAVLIAYLCCQLRRWMALLYVAVFAGGDITQNIAELVVTVPLLIAVYRLVSPTLRDMSHSPVSIQLQSGFLPLVGYLFDYVTRVYTDWLEQGVAAAVEFMPFMYAAAYLFFSLYSAQNLRRQNEQEQLRQVMDLQLHQSEIQIQELKKNQEQAAAYRHDLRHHLRYLASCLGNGEVEQAQDYILELDSAITQQAMNGYCSNTAVNLILSSFVTQAENIGISMTVRLEGETRLSRISDNDLCVLLSNALENAVHACMEVRRMGKEPWIRIHGYEKNQKIFLEIQNTCVGTVSFVDGLPVTKHKGHGIGVRSICAIVEKYGGMQVFSQEGEVFSLRMSV